MFKPGKQKWFIIFFTLIFFDQVSKFWAERVGLVAINKGISFGWNLWDFDSQVVAGIFLVILVVVLFFIFRNFFGWIIGSSFFLAGAVSNIIDRFFIDGVRDWITIPGLNLQNNLADYWIFVGVVLLVFRILELKMGKEILDVE